MRRILLLLLWALGSCPSASLRAEFILDDFDDPAEVVSPEMKGDFVLTNNVGALNATRSIRIAGVSADPMGSIDVAKTSSSTLTARLDSVVSTSSLTPIISYVSVPLFL